MNTLVNFPIVELLEEKGFEFRQNEIYYNPISGFTTYEEITPTIAEVVMWLYKKHGIWIWVEKYSSMFRPYAEENGDERFGKWEGHKYNSPTEAYEAAIEYCLNNLI